MASVWHRQQWIHRSWWIEGNSFFSFETFKLICYKCWLKSSQNSFFSYSFVVIHSKMWQMRAYIYSPHLWQINERKISVLIYWDKPEWANLVWIDHHVKADLSIDQFVEQWFSTGVLLHTRVPWDSVRGSRGTSYHFYWPLVLFSVKGCCKILT